MNKRLYCSPDRKLCGVCGGIADYFNVDPSLVRLIAVEIAFFTAIIPSLLVYFIVALVIPQPPEDYAQHYQNTARRFYRGPEKKLAGVCSGIANYLNMDPTLVRLLFVCRQRTVYLHCLRDYFPVGRSSAGLCTAALRSAAVHAAAV